VGILANFEEAESMSSNILLRTIFLQVPIIPNPVRVVGGRRSGLGIGRSKRHWLQLMCCALSRLPSSQLREVGGVV